ncbi:MAG TPA: excinuclease ABC subunit A, partial [Phycisphaerae bacterium]|nr:excinuclease ABC subunit A [Phycisphaerae bacterium]
MARESDERREIRIAGAREHNLRDVNLALPKGRLICFTGVSGSGKSSLAFDTLYAEGQRRYIESLSSYARQFLGELPKPDVDQISGLAPSISIQQKTSGWNPRSTVGTITQIHDYLRVLFARAGEPACPRCGRPIAAQTREQMLAQVLALPEGTRFLLLAPKVRGQKGEHRDLFAELVNQGYVRARVDGEIVELTSPPPLDRNRRHDVEVVIDRLEVRPNMRARLSESLDLALTVGQGTAMASVLGSPTPGDRPSPSTRDLLLSSAYACTTCGVGFEQPTPQMFSFNSPQGMCPDCDGLGTRFDFDPDLLIPDRSRSFWEPCIVPLRRPPGRWARHIYQGVADYLDVDLDRPWRELPAAARRAILHGTGAAHITYEWRSRQGVWKHGGPFEGVIAELSARYRKSSSGMVRRYYEQFMRQATCTTCNGSRLAPQALAVRLCGPVDGTGASERSKKGRPEAGPQGSRSAGKPGPGTAALNIDEACKLSIRDALRFFEGLEVEGVRGLIAAEPLKEIRARLRFLVDVGLDYLTLDRAAPTLSGGESQRIRLASQIGCGLVGVLYVLDEPSIGLPPRDNRRLLASL